MEGLGSWKQRPKIKIMPIDPKWNFDEALANINQQFPPWGLVGPQLRNRQVEAWGQLVGRSRAISEFDMVVDRWGSLSALGREYHITPHTLKAIRVFFTSLPADNVNIGRKFVLGTQVNIEETRQCEFKDISSSRRPGDSIKNTADEYVVAFLNSEGGSIYWGVGDKDGSVIGVRLNQSERDDIRRVVSQQLNGIQPTIDPSVYRIEFYQVYNTDDTLVPDLWVIEITVPQLNMADPYYTSGGDAFVRVDGATVKLKGPALTDWIKRRLSSPGVPVEKHVKQLPLEGI